MFNKRGQLTIFVIVAIVLLFSVLVYFFIVTRESEVSIEEQRSGPAGEVYTYTKECIEDAAFSAAERFGLQQGYYVIPEDISIETAIYRIAYYYLRGNILVPEIDLLEREFSKFLSEEIFFECSDFSEFENRFDITLGIIDSKTTILEDSVIVNVDYPIIIRSSDTNTEISRFSYTLPIRIGHIIDVSRDLVEKTREDPGFVDLTFLLNQDVDVSIADYDECTKIYILLDELSETNTGDPYVFSFAVGFEEEYCTQ